MSNETQGPGARHRDLGGRMTLLSALAACPDDTPISVTIGAGTMTVGDLREAFAGVDRPIYVTTERAAEMFGWSADYWRRIAPKIPGAVRDRHWHLPVKGCEAHIAARAAKPIRRRKRGPWFPREP